MDVWWARPVATRLVRPWFDRLEQIAPFLIRHVLSPILERGIERRRIIAIARMTIPSVLGGLPNLHHRAFDRPTVPIAHLPHDIHDLSFRGPRLAFHPSQIIILIEHRVDMALRLARGSEDNSYPLWLARARGRPSIMR